MNYKEIMKQIAHKKGKVAKFKKHNLPRDRKFGKGTKICRRCGRVGRGIIGKYKLNLCRQCFREIGEKIGFNKYS